MPQTLVEISPPIVTSEFMNRFLAVNQARYFTPPGTTPRVHNRCFIRREAFDTFVALKRAARTGDLVEAKRLHLLLRGDPQFGGAAKSQLNQVYLREALSESRRLRGPIRPCLSCKTPFAVEPGVSVVCPHCGSPVLIRGASTRRGL